MQVVGSRGGTNRTLKKSWNSSFRDFFLAEKKPRVHLGVRLFVDKKKYKFVTFASLYLDKRAPS